MKTFKKRLAIFLCVCMVFSLIPSNCFAENISSNENVEENIVLEENVSTESEGDLLEENDDEDNNLDEEDADKENDGGENLVGDGFIEEPEDDLTSNNENNLNDISTPSDIDDEDIDIEENIASESEADEELEEKSIVKNKMLFGASGTTYTTDDFLYDDDNLNGKTNLCIEKGTGVRGSVIKVLSASSDTGLYEDGKDLIIYINANDNLELGTKAFQNLIASTGSEGIKSIKGLSNIDMSSCTSIEAMFKDSTYLSSIDFTGFDTSNVLNMSHLFENCTGMTNFDLRALDTSSATDMSYMFYCCIGIRSINFSSFNTENVENMEEMFGTGNDMSGIIFTGSLDLTSFNTKKAKDHMHHMLCGLIFAREIKVSKNDFVYSSGQKDLFYDRLACTMAKGNDGYLQRVATNNDCVVMFNTNVQHVEGGVNKGYNSVTLKSGNVGTQYISIGDKITEPTNVSSGYKFGGWYKDNIYKDKWDFNEAVTSNNITLYAKWLLVAKFDIGSEATWVNGGSEREYEVLGSTVDVKIPLASDVSYNGAKLVRWELLDSDYRYNGFNPGDTYDAFQNFSCKAVWQIDAATFNTDDFMQYIPDKTAVEKIKFVKGNSAPTVNVLKVLQPMSKAGIYNDGNEIIIYTKPNDIVKMSKKAFKDFPNLVGIEGLNSLNTSDLTDFSELFSGCKKLTNVDISGFDTRKATNMSKMFYDCEKLVAPNICDVQNFDVTNVTDMSYMFYNCDNFTFLDLRTFNTSKVNDMSHMFENCTNLSEIKTTNLFVVASADTDMYKNCGCASASENVNSAIITFSLDVYDNGILKDNIKLVNGDLPKVYTTKGKKINEPLKASLSNAKKLEVFGWYTDKEHNNLWDFANDVVNDAQLTLYPKWGVEVQYILDDNVSKVTGATWKNSFVPETKLEYKGGSLIADLPDKDNVVLPAGKYKLTSWSSENYAYDFSNQFDALKYRKIYAKICKYHTITFYDGASPFTCYDNTVNSIDVTKTEINNAIASSTMDYTEHSESIYFLVYYREFSQPTKSGYEFMGWWQYNDVTSTLFNIANTRLSREIPVFGDTKLYAVWRKIHKITYYNGSSNLGFRSYKNGEIAQPLNISQLNCTFAGWHTEPGLVNKFDFSKPICQDYTLYAKWNKNSSTTTTTTTTTKTTSKSSGSSGGGGGGGYTSSKTLGAPSPLQQPDPLQALQQQVQLPQQQQPTPVKQVQVNNTSNTAPVVDSTNATWSFDTATGTFKLEVKDAQGNPVKVQNGFCKLSKVEQQVIDNQVVNVPVESLYCFDENGNMCTGWVQTADMSWHYFDTDQATIGAGAVNTWKVVDGESYYFDAEGKMLTNTTTPDGKIVGVDGKMINLEKK